ncbi:MAG: hypothetical protein R2731_20280, partial [Nocardioides sp.]
MAERIAAFEPRRSTRATCVDEPGRQRLQRWYSQYPQLSDDHLAGYLAANGIGAETFLGIVSEAAGAPPGRVATEPPWVRHIQAAFASTAQEASRPIQRWARESETVRFLNLVEPLIRRAQRRLRAGF